MLWFNPVAKNYMLDSRLLTPSPLQQDGEEKWIKGKLVGRDKNSVIRQQRKYQC